jgi:hypothetical protein
MPGAGALGSSTVPRAQAGTLGTPNVSQRAPAADTGYTLPRLFVPPGAGLRAQAAPLTPRPSTISPGQPLPEEEAQSKPAAIPNIVLFNMPTTGQAAEMRLRKLSESYLRRAHSSFREGDYTRARCFFETVAAMEARPAVGQLGVVHASFALNQYASATAALQTLLRAKVNIFAVDLARFLYEGTEKLDVHTGHFRPLISLDQASPASLSLASYILWINGERNEALAAARAAASRAPKGDGSFQFLFSAIQEALQAPQPQSEP